MENVKVMLVEDSGILVSDIKETLEPLDVEIPWVYASGEEAIEDLETEEPDLILMDIKLEGELDGVDATNKIRDRWDIPVAYLTAYSSEKYMDRVKNSDALAFLVKPLQKSDLRTLVEWIQSDDQTSEPSLERGEYMK